MASVTIPFPSNLTERRQDITTVHIEKTVAGLSPEEFEEPTATRALLTDRRTHRKRLELELSGSKPHWLAETLERAGNMLSLPRGWDGLDASPIEPSTVGSAILLLAKIMGERSSLAQWTPTQRSGVQLDWHEQGVDLEISIEPGESSGYVVFSDHEDPSADWDGPAAANLNRLRRLLESRLVR